MENYVSPKIIYNLDVLRQRLQFISTAAKENGICILFAVKSFPSEEILTLANDYVHGFEISNIAEYSLLPKDNFNQVISINDPTVNIQDLTVYTLLGHKKIYYNLDSFDDSIIRAAQNYTRTTMNLQFGIRLSHTALGIDSADYRSGITCSRFGIKIHDAIGLFKDNPIISGIHIHNGSESNNIESYKLMSNKIVLYLNQYNINVKYINFGGGLHKLSNKEITLLFKEIRRLIPQNITIIFEPGNAFSRNTGYAIAKIKTVKEIAKEKYIVITDISYESNLKWTRPKYYSLYKIETDELNNRYIDVTFYGASCFEQDYITDCQVEISDFYTNIIKDKLVIFNNINGYAYAWNQSFNGLPMSDVYFI